MVNKMDIEQHSNKEMTIIGYTSIHQKIFGSGSVNKKWLTCLACHALCFRKILNGWKKTLNRGWNVMVGAYKMETINSGNILVVENKPKHVFRKIAFINILRHFGSIETIVRFGELQ